MSYQKFIDDVTLYSYKANIGLKVLSSVFYVDKYLRIDKFAGKEKSTEIFLIIPSIFNSTKIFFINSAESFIQRLQNLGDIYLINWLDNKEITFSFNDYIRQINIVINILNVEVKQKVSLIGHCIGGNMALAAAHLNTGLIKNLMLMTTPWEFSHFKMVLSLSKIVAPLSLLRNLDFVPKIYSQILFCILFGDQLKHKIDKYNGLTDKSAQALFLQIEKWLLSGESIPKKAYIELMEMIDNNIFNQNQWFIGRKLIDISLLKVPVYQIAASEDRLVPLSSILPLHQKLADATLKEVKGGHISFLISDKLNILFKDYSKWLQR